MWFLYAVCALVLAWVVFHITFAPIGSVRNAMPGRTLLLKAADLTARPLQQVIQIVEGKLGPQRSQEAGPLIGSVLLALVDNYRQCMQ